MDQRVPLRYETRVKSWHFITSSFCDHRPLSQRFMAVRPRLWLTEIVCGLVTLVLQIQAVFAKEF